MGLLNILKGKNKEEGNTNGEYDPVADAYYNRQQPENAPQPTQQDKDLEDLRQFYMNNGISGNPSAPVFPPAPEADVQQQNPSAPAQDNNIQDIPQYNPYEALKDGNVPNQNNFNPYGDDLLQADPANQLSPINTNSNNDPAFPAAAESNVPTITSNDDFIQAPDTTLAPQPDTTNTQLTEPVAANGPEIMPVNNISEVPVTPAVNLDPFMDNKSEDSKLFNDVEKNTTLPVNLEPTPSPVVTELENPQEVQTDLSTDTESVEPQIAVEAVVNTPVIETPIPAPIITEKEDTLMTETNDNASEPIKESKVEDAPKNLILKKIGLVGVNTLNFDNNLGNDIRQLTKTLFEEGYEIYSESNRDLGGFISMGATDAAKQLTLVQLKPYLSNINSIQSQSEMGNHKVFLYSNYIDRLENLVKSIQVFVFLSIDNLEALTLLTNVWSLSKMYEGQHKPVILYGANLKTEFEKIISDLNLDKQMANVIEFAANKTELDAILSKYNSDYSQLTELNVPNLVDRRQEGDEKHFVV